MPQLDPSVPKHKALSEYIRQQIADGVFRRGDKLTSENTLAEEFNISRQTVRQAIGTLETEGILVRRRGSGTYINASPVKSQRTMTIGVIITYVDSYIFTDIIKGLEQVLTSKGYTMSLGVTHNRVENETRLLTSLLEKGVDGIIAEGTKTALPNPNLHLYEQLNRCRIPYVFMNGYYRSLPCCYVVTDDRGTGYRAAELLRKAGHRHIGGVFKADDMQGHERYAGFIQQLHESGAELDEDAVIWYSTGDLIGLLGGDYDKLVYRRLKDCTGVVCYNDDVAMRLMELLRRCGRRIPEDMSIVSIDNARMSRLADPPLTTFGHPSEAVGREAALRLCNMIETGMRDAPVVMDMPLVERQSVVPYRPKSEGKE